MSGQLLALPTELMLYIRSLDEPIEKYQPYFDALLIKRRNQPSFFRDLKSFRCQEHVIALLTTPSDTPDIDIKQLHRTCSRFFLESRFAHPWCRTTPGATKEGWFKAEWGNLKKQSEAKRKEEERLHRLLVPIWCGFRVRMMPSTEQMTRFSERQKQTGQRKREELGSDEAEEKRLDSDKVMPREQSGTRRVDEVEIRAEVKSICCQTTNRIPRPPHFTAEAFVSEDDDQLYDHCGNGEDDGAATAGKMFIGIAATSFLAKNPRARKYLWKKLQK